MTGGQRILVTGGLGFIGGRFVVRWTAAHPHDDVRDLDVLTYAGDMERVRAAGPRHAHVRADITDPVAVDAAMRDAELVIHFAAESHVDRSIHDPGSFLRTNVLGTQVLLEAARKADVERFHHVGTDEVFGSLPLDSDETFDEETPYAPRSPYAASKAAADHLVRAYATTYGLNVTISHGSNTYGPFQHPEKFVPRLVARALSGARLPVYGTGRNVRDWLHVDDHCAGIEAILAKGRPGRSYCIGADQERNNLHVANAVARLVGVGPERIELVPDRPGHDLRYAMDSRRAREELGWRPAHPFDEGLAATVAWYRANQTWWRPHLEASERAYSSMAAPGPV